MKKPKDACPVCNNETPQVVSITVGDHTYTKFTAGNADEVVFEIDREATGTIGLTRRYPNQMHFTHIGQRSLMVGDLLTVIGSGVCFACGGEHSVQGAMRRKLEGRW